MRYLFFINPTAGKGKAQQSVIDDINKYFSQNEAEYKIHITRFRGDAEETAKREAQTGDKITMFACGGEGTEYEVLNGIMGYDNVTLGVIPCGSANDFLKCFSDKSLFLNIEKQINGDIECMDVIKAGDRYCLNGCSVGMDAMVGRDMTIFKNWPLVSGSMAYNLSLVKTFFHKLGVKIKMFIDDGEPQERDCLFAVVANGPCYGGGFFAAPNAVPNDGLLDFTTVDTITRFKILKFLPLYKSGKHSHLDCCHLSNCKSMEFTSEIPIPINLDGEIVVSKSMRFEIIKKGIKFVLPKGIRLLNVEKENKVLTKS